jgi:hypothetical protein
MRTVGGATGLVGRQPVPMPANDAREVTATTTTGSTAGRWQTVIVRSVSAARRASSIFQARTR